MSKAFINVESIRQKLLKNPEVQAKAYLEVKKLVDVAHEDMIDEFNKHPVTQELDGGVNSENISGTLNGYGNLYSFIGFENGENPTDTIREKLKNVKVESNPQINGKSLSFKTTFPTLKEIYEATPVPTNWDTGSWAAKIERGISGFASYMNKIGLGRSQGGIQAKKPNGEAQIIRQGEFKKRTYLSKILLDFKYRLFNKAGRI